MEKLTTDFTFWFLRLSWKNIFCKHLQFFFSLIKQPQVHFTPRLIFQETLIFKISLAMFLPQVVRLFCKSLVWTQGILKDLKITFSRVPVSWAWRQSPMPWWIKMQNKSHHVCLSQVPPNMEHGNTIQRYWLQTGNHIASNSRALHLS